MSVHIETLSRFVRFFLGGKLLVLVGSEDLLTYSWSHTKVNLVVQDNAQKGIVNVDLAVVLDEAQFPEFVHEKIDPGPRCANHLRQHLLRYLGKDLLRQARRAITRQQQQSACQAFLAGVEELVDQILLDADVSRQHMRDEAVGELVFAMEHANHLVFLDNEYGGGRNRGCRSHANGLAGKTPFPQKIARSKDRHNGFSAGLIDHRKLHAAFLNVQHILGGIALRKDGFFSSKLGYLS